MIVKQSQTNIVLADFVLEGIASEPQPTGKIDISAEIMAEISKSVMFRADSELQNCTVRFDDEERFKLPQKIFTFKKMMDSEIKFTF